MVHSLILIKNNLKFYIKDLTNKNTLNKFKNIIMLFT